MKIKFLKPTTAPKQFTKYCGDGCCSWPEWEDEFFTEGQEEDPEEYGRNIDLSGLTYRVDYDIIEYP
jgi:hypothetical protein